MAGNKKNPNVPNFTVTINGTPLPTETEARVVGITVEHDVVLPGMFVLEFAGSRNVKKETAWIDDKKMFEVGNVVEVKMGYAGALQTVIVGEITGLDPEFTSDAPPGLTVRGYDRRHRLHRGRKTRTFVQQKYSDIATTIAGEAGLTADVEDSTVVHDHVFQANQTNMEFLQECARRINYEILVEDKKMIFRAVHNATSEILTLTMEDDLLEFRPRLSTMRQLSEVDVLAWDPKEKKAITGTSKIGDEASLMGGQKNGGDLAKGFFGDAVGKVGDRPVMTQAEADQVAKARFNSVSLALISGEGTCRGRGDLAAGTVIKIDGVGTRFSGKYYVITAVHRYTPQHAYQTRFQFRRNAS